MAKFVFKLQSYLELKEKLEEQKKNEYGKAIQLMEIEKRKKEQLQQESIQKIELLRTKMKNGIKPDVFQRFNLYIEYLAKAIEKQQKVVEAALVEVEKKRVALVEAMKERKMMEKLRENDYEEFHVEELRDEQKIVDEITSFRYSNRT